MAFEDVNKKSSFTASSKIEIGGTVEGYVLGFKEGQYGPIIQMQIDGEAVDMGTSGNLKYMVKDKKIKLGLLTRITRLADEKVKASGKGPAVTKTMFKVEQDPASALAGVSTTEAASSVDSFKEKIAALKAGNK